MEAELFSKNWTQLVKPRTPIAEDGDLTESYGKFTIEPLERGYGITIGNALRRVLLSSIQGAAITTVKFDKVVHEFASIPNVVEDVTDIILNLKLVNFVLHSAEPQIVKIQARGAHKITAGDIICNQNVEVVNADQHIAELTDNGELSIELKVELGKGWSPAEGNKSEELAHGEIPVDSIFTPIENVSYQVSDARVGQRTDFDKLVMEITTNGSIKAQDALAYSAKIIQEQLEIFINFDYEPVKEVDDDDDEYSELIEKLMKSVSELELTVRSANCLHNASIKTLGQLVQRTEAEMLKTKNFGRKSLKELKEILKSMSLSFGMQLPKKVLEKITEEEDN